MNSKILFPIIIVAVMAVSVTAISLYATSFDSASIEIQNEFAKNSDYDYDDYGLKLNFVELREISQDSASGIKEHSTTKIDRDSFYSVVAEVQNRDGFEKDFYLGVTITDSNGDVQKDGARGTVMPYDSILLDNGGSQMIPGETLVEVHIFENLSTRDQAMPVSMVWFLKEKGSNAAVGDDSSRMVDKTVSETEKGDVPRIKVAVDDTSSDEPYKTDFRRNYEHHGSQMSRQNLCVENNGYWDSESRHCYFQTRDDMKQSDHMIDESLKRQVTGETAKIVCKIIGMECPESPVFNGQLQPDMSIYFIYVQGEVSYTFKISEDQIRYLFVDPNWRPSEGTEPPIGWITYDESAAAATG